MDKVIALLEARIAFLKIEEARQPRTGYSGWQKWRRLEAAHLLAEIRKLQEGQHAS